MAFYFMYTSVERIGICLKLIWTSFFLFKTSNLPICINYGLQFLHCHDWWNASLQQVSRNFIHHVYILLQLEWKKCDYFFENRLLLLQRGEIEGKFFQMASEIIV